MRRSYHYDWRKSWDRKQDAYMTLEASFIFTYVLILMVAIIYPAFFLYDRCLFAQDSYILCFRESYVKDENTDLSEELKSLVARQFGTKYFMLDGESSDASVDKDKIIFSGSAALTPRLFASTDNMPSGIWSMNFSSSARKSDPPYSIRHYRRIRYLAGKVIDSKKE